MIIKTYYVKNSEGKYFINRNGSRVTEEVAKASEFPGQIAQLMVGTYPGTTMEEVEEKTVRPIEVMTKL